MGYQTPKQCLLCNKDSNEGLVIHYAPFTGQSICTVCLRDFRRSGNPSLIEYICLKQTGHYSWKLPQSEQEKYYPKSKPVQETKQIINNTISDRCIHEIPNKDDCELDKANGECNGHEHCAHQYIPMKTDNTKTCGRCARFIKDNKGCDAPIGGYCYCEDGSKWYVAESQMACDDAFQKKSCASCGHFHAKPKEYNGDRFGGYCETPEFPNWKDVYEKGQTGIPASLVSTFRQCHKFILVCEQPTCGACQKYHEQSPIWGLCSIDGDRVGYAKDKGIDHCFKAKKAPVCARCYRCGVEVLSPQINNINLSMQEEGKNRIGGNLCSKCGDEHYKYRREMRFGEWKAQETAAGRTWYIDRKCGSCLFYHVQSYAAQADCRLDATHAVRVYRDPPCEEYVENKGICCRCGLFSTRQEFGLYYCNKCYCIIHPIHRIVGGKVIEDTTERIQRKVEIKKGELNMEYTCPKCGNEFTQDGEMKFCPYCRAEMVQNGDKDIPTRRVADLETENNNHLVMIGNLQMKLSRAEQLIAVRQAEVQAIKKDRDRWQKQAMGQNDQLIEMAAKITQLEGTLKRCEEINVRQEKALDKYRQKVPRRCRACLRKYPMINTETNEEIPAREGWPCDCYRGGRCHYDEDYPNDPKKPPSWPLWWLGFKRYWLRRRFFRQSRRSRYERDIERYYRMITGRSNDKGTNRPS